MHKLQFVLKNVFIFLGITWIITQRAFLGYIMIYFGFVWSKYANEYIFNNCISHYTLLLRPCLLLNYSVTTHVPTNLCKIQWYLYYSNMPNISSPLHTNAIHFPQTIWYTQALYSCTPFLNISPLRNLVKFGLLMEQAAVTLRNQASSFGKQLILQEVWTGWKCWQS